VHEGLPEYGTTVPGVSSFSVLVGEIGSLGWWWWSAAVRPHRTARHESRCVGPQTDSRRLGGPLVITKFRRATVEALLRPEGIDAIRAA